MKKLILLSLLILCPFLLLANTEGAVLLPGWVVLLIGLFVPGVLAFGVKVQNNLNALHKHTDEDRRLIQEIHTQTAGGRSERLHEETQKILERLSAVQEQMAKTLDRLVTRKEIEAEFRNAHQGG